MARWVVLHAPRADEGIDLGQRCDEAQPVGVRGGRCGVARFSEERADRAGSLAPRLQATRPAYFPNKPLMT